MKLFDIWGKALGWVADIRFYNLGLILWGDSHYQIKGLDQRAVLDIIQQGDVFVRRFSHYLGSVAIPGYWAHAALFVGDNSVIHMLGKGITKEDILTFMRCDDIAVLRPKDKTKIPDAIKKAQGFLEEKVQYDYLFNKNCPDRLYCTELINDAYGGLTFKGKLGSWILPDDMLRTNELKIIWAKDRARWMKEDNTKEAQ